MPNVLMDDNQLRMWAYDPESFINVGQDFELTVANLDRVDIILECASDNDCPMQQFFVNCAYLIVGNAVRGEDTVQSKNEVLAFVRRAEKTGNEYLLEFVFNARDLVEDPRKFDYDQWCGGELSRITFER